MKEPLLLNGGKVEDNRGKLVFFNEFDLSKVRRFYQITNNGIDFKRGWQGHKIEMRWFQATVGSFKIQLIAFEDYIKGEHINCQTFCLSIQNPTILYVPPGFVTCIQAETKDNCLTVFSDYKLGEIEDEIRFDLHYFENIIETYRW